MKSSALPEFWTRFEQLPPQAQRIARKNFLLWQKQPGLKSLGFKRINHDLWSVRAGSGFRALAARSHLPASIQSGRVPRNRRDATAAEKRAREKMLKPITFQ